MLLHLIAMVGSAAVDTVFNFANCYKVERRLTADELPLIVNLSEQIKVLSGKVGFEDVDMEPAVLSGENRMPSAGLQQTA